MTAMPNVTGLFETHLTVSDLDRSIAFYRDLVGLPPALELADRGAAFFWIGAPGQAMLGLWPPLALSRWLGPADETDERLLSLLAGPVLDVGCGPGRHLHELARRGVFGLGVDLSPVAVALARDRGANAIVGSIFDHVPGAGTWQTALLLDGNIGIGGAPERFLTRVGTLLGPGGEVLVELDPPGMDTRRLVARIETPTDVSAWFRWARVGAADIEGLAAASGYAVLECVQHGSRWFARLGHAGRRCERLPSRSVAQAGAWTKRRVC